MRYWFTSDLHLFHTNIIKYSHRPFADADEMNEALVTNWNEAIKPDDTVYFLGDFAMGHRNRGEELVRTVRSLHGKIHWLFGNHDRSKVKKLLLPLPNIVEGLDYKVVHIENQDIVLFHYAMQVWDKSHHGAWHLYGHSHGSLRINMSIKAFDVGVDCHMYKPLSFEGVAAIMKHHGQESVDHHSEKPDA